MADTLSLRPSYDWESFLSLCPISDSDRYSYLWVASPDWPNVYSGLGICSFDWPKYLPSECFEYWECREEVRDLCSLFSSIYDLDSTAWAWASSCIFPMNAILFEEEETEEFLIWKVCPSIKDSVGGWFISCILGIYTNYAGGWDGFTSYKGL